MKYLMMVCLLVVTFCTSATALTLTPGGELDSGPETSQPLIDVYLFDTYGINFEIYKNDGGESGPFKDLYTTQYFNTPSDPKDADITWDGGITGPTNPAEYLLVKDGNQDPGWYLFDLGSQNWDGMETLQLREFWPNQGSISHVTLYGERSSVPEPATMILFGAGLAGLAGSRLRKKK